MHAKSTKRWFSFCLVVGITACTGVISARAAEVSPIAPATVAEAAKVLDVSALPLLEGAERPQHGGIAGLFYKAPGTVKVAYDFHHKQLLDRKWKELPGGYQSDESSNTTFARDGYSLSLTVFSTGKAGEANVQITNHGNVKLDKLPLPPGTKPLYAGPASAMFVTDAPANQTAEACRKLLISDGWQPYGTAGDVQYFKLNAVRLSARVMQAPADGKTHIDYSTVLMSAELPAPDDALGLQYSDTPAQLFFDTVAAEQEVADFYRKALGKAGWKATTDTPIKFDFKHELIFRNPAKDLLSLVMSEVQGKTRVLLKYQSAAEVAELDRRAEAEIKRRKAEQNKPLPKLAITIPQDAKEIEQTKNRIEFKLSSGKAKAIVESWRKQFTQDGWKEGTIALDNMAGSVSFDKGDQHLTLIYSDTGFLPAEITLQAMGVELERAGEKK